MKKLKVGDYVEVVDAEYAGIENGEQGMVMDDKYQYSLQLMFPAREDVFSDGGFFVMAEQLKLIYRPRKGK